MSKANHDLEYIVIDDFFDDPETVLKRALACSFDRSCRLPGSRSVENVSSLELHNEIERLAKKKFVKVNSYFQYSTEIDAKDRFVHSDLSEWAGIVYLVKDKDGTPGTSLFRHRLNQITRYGKNNPELAVAALKRKTSPDRILFELHEDRESFDRWEKLLTVTVRYNRLFLYNATQFHCNESSWGSTLENSRLVQAIFAHEQ
jgi:hypothetical protein